MIEKKTSDSVLKKKNTKHYVCTARTNFFPALSRSEYEKIEKTNSLVS